MEPEVVANAAPVDDQARWRMCGGIVLGRAFSLKTTGFWPLKVWEKKSFLSGRLRAGAGMVEVGLCASMRVANGAELQSASVRLVCDRFGERLGKGAKCRKCRERMVVK